MKRQAIMAMVAATAMTVTLAAGGQKPGKVTQIEYPAQITFWDRADDGVRSDGATYKNGENGLKVVFQDKSDGSGSKQFLLTVPDRGKGRSLYFDYRNPVATSCDLNRMDRLAP